MAQSTFEIPTRSEAFKSLHPRMWDAVWIWARYGRSVKTIAKHMGIAEATVNGYLSDAVLRSGATNREELHELVLDEYIDLTSGAA